MTALTYMDTWLAEQSGKVTDSDALFPFPGHLKEQPRSMAKRYMHDLDSSISIQQRLLPERPYAVNGVEVAVHYLPIMGVSGDYYDFLPFQENQTALAIGDVCGKGMRAAQIMASMCAVLRAQVHSGTSAADELLAYLNRSIYHYTSSSQFVTLLYGIWDSDARTFTYSNAGHPPVLYYQAATGMVNRLDVGSIVLGVCEEVEYPTESVSLDTGDALVLYTDGIIETSNASEKIFGIQRLSDIVAKYGKEQSDILAEEILNAASRFGHRGWEDDVTLMVIKSD